MTRLLIAALALAAVVLLAPRGLAWLAMASDPQPDEGES